MSQIYLHIGLPKTGSTVIQSFLSLNRDQLASAGWKYPSFFGGENHLELAIASADDKGLLAHQFARIQSQEELDERRAAAIELLHTHTQDGSDWVMSSEHLASHLTSMPEVERLAGLLEHFDVVRPVMWVRRQNEVAASSQSTWVLDGRPDRFDVERHLQYTNRYDYKKIGKRWQEAFGEAVEIRLYGGSGLLDDLLVSMGLPSLENWQEPEAANVSLTNVEIELLRELNARLPRWKDERPDRTQGDFRRVIANSGRGEKVRLSDADSRRLLEAHAESNQWVLKNAANRDGHDDFFSPPDGDHPGNLDVELTLDDALELSTELWRKARLIQKRLQWEQRKARKP